VAVGSREVVELGAVVEMHAAGVVRMRESVGWMWLFEIVRVRLAMRWQRRGELFWRVRTFLSRSEIECRIEKEEREESKEK